MLIAAVTITIRYDVYSSCSVYHDDHLKALFGENFMVPDRDLSDESLYERTDEGKIGKEKHQHNLAYHTPFTYDDFNYDIPIVKNLGLKDHEE